MSLPIYQGHQTPSAQLLLQLMGVTVIGGGEVTPPFTVWSMRPGLQLPLPSFKDLVQVHLRSPICSQIHMSMLIMTVLLPIAYYDFIAQRPITLPISGLVLCNPCMLISVLTRFISSLPYVVNK